MRKAKERHTTQYFEIAGNRAIYHDGWFARTIHRAPWEAKPRRTLEDNSAWELYDVRSDFSLANDLAAKNPQKLAELQALFLQEAEKYHVLPMDDRVFERLDAAAVGRPDLMGGRTSMTLAEGMTGMMESVFINVKNRSKTITAEVDVPAGRRERHRSSRRAAASAAGRCTSRTACRPTTTTSSGCSRPAIAASQAAGAGQGDDPASTSPTTAAGRARAAWARCSSTARRSPKAASSTPRRASSPRTRPPTSASTSARRSSKPSAPSTQSKFTGHIPKVTVEVRK